jgi:hypothetical protein
MCGTVLRLTLLGVLGGGGAVAAQERLPLPKDALPEAEPAAPAVVPAPLPLMPHVVPAPGGFQPMAFYRTSAYEHWQYRSVGMGGRWYPRVLNTPDGYFYDYNGKPYPWTPPPTRYLGVPGTVGH